MLEPMRIAGDDRRFIAIYVIGVIAVTVRVVTLASRGRDGAVRRLRRDDGRADSFLRDADDRGCSLHRSERDRHLHGQDQGIADQAGPVGPEHPCMSG